MSTSIEWAQETLNFAVGCTRVSDGCRNCYAERFVHRQMQEAHKGLTVMRNGGPGWNGTVRFLPERLSEATRWKKGKRIFVNSLSDTFHPSLSHQQRLAMFGAFVAAPQHVWMVLTKRPEVAVDFERWLIAEGEREHMTFRELAVRAYCEAVKMPDHWRSFERTIPTHGHAWWIGVTAENQQEADRRIPKLLSLTLLPTVRFVSYEPAIGPVRFDRIGDDEMGATYDALRGCMSGDHEHSGGPRLGWVIVGGESGHGARPFDIAWARSVVAQCKAAGTPVFYKQGGASNRCEHSSKGACLDCAPPELRVREFPGGAT